MTPCNGLVFFTPPQNRGGVIFSLQFVCVSVCPALLVNKIPAEWMHRYTLGRFVLKFHKNRTGKDVIVTILHISNFIQLTNFILGTKTQQHNVHLDDRNESDIDGR